MKKQRKPVDLSCGSSHPWHKKTRWQKRIYGWLSYQLAAWFALVYPEAVDTSMYLALRDQFVDKKD